MKNIEEIKKLAEKVNDYWLTQMPESGNCSWERGAYFIGCMAAYRMTGKKEYLDYALKWANDNNWHFYRNGTGKEYRSADCKICSQTYMELMDLVPDCGGTYEHMLKEMDFILNDPECDYWWWVDTIYMSFPVYHMFGVKFNDERYFEKVHKLFVNSRVDRTCYDEEEHMWFRDENYIPSVKLSDSGKKIFWGRGNGWVLGGLARGLMVMPKDWKYYEEYKEVYCDMVDALVKWQQEDGFWRCAITEPEMYDNVPETSATVLISYGIAKGIELGILDKDTYFPYVKKAFEAMCDIALDENGKIGYVQGVAGWPGPVYPETTKDYAVGTFLLLCEEMTKLL